MEEETNLGNTELLIDFNSPISKGLLHTPLIPVPKVTNPVALSPTNSNPFDVVAKQTISTELKDPFESVFKTAYDGLNDSKSSFLDTKENQEVYNSEIAMTKNKSIDLNISPIESITPNKRSFRIIEEESNKLFTNVKNVEDSIQDSTTENATILKKTETKSLIFPDSESQSQVSSDFSTEESLKAVIAKRVNKCIQKVLNNTLKTKMNKSDNDLQTIEDNISLKKTLKKKSSSFMSLSHSHIKCGKMNQTYTDSSFHNEPFVLEKQLLNTLDSPIVSCDIRMPSSPSKEVSKTEDHIFHPTEKEQVFQEANKLARTFSRIAESFCQSTGSELSSLEDDLFSCKPRWSYAADSSEEEEEKLRNDPALNIRVSITTSKDQAQADSGSLTAFKNRHRLSLNAQQIRGSQEESDMERNQSIQTNLTAVQVLPSIVTTAPVVLINPEEKHIRLKKICAGDSKRGPMRAVVPVQRMVRDSAKCEGKITNRETSPVRKQNSMQLMKTPNKNNCSLGMQPVASSTPNKSVYGIPNLLTPDIESSNKRHSLGSTIESRKSRTLVTNEGSKQRSSSANSSIPTPLMPAKPLKALPLVKSPTKPRSTSSLPRSFSTNNAQMNRQRDNKSEKSKPNKQTKSSINPRPLSEVTSKTGRVRSAVNTLSNLVSGKGKRVAVRDKENRAPV